jgi:alpha-galactosidase
VIAHRTYLKSVFLVLPLAVASCGGENGSPPAGEPLGTGGTTGGGGVTGGAMGGAGGNGTGAAQAGATGGTPASGGVVTAGGSGTGGLSSTGGAPGTGGVPTTGGSSSGGTATGGQSATGGAGTGGVATGGAGTGGVATGGAAGVPSGGSAGSPTGGAETGGAAGAGTGGTEPTGGAGGSGTGGSQQCDTTWDADRNKGDGIALTPPMGWNSWNVFHENINENQIREIADAMVSSGMRDAGYEYLNLDDKWMDDDGRDGQGNLVGDSGRFPSGIAALADYVHSLGLKFGLYGDRGTETCANQGTGRESGSYGRETQDAQTFAAWGVDYLKYDNCEPGPGRDNDQAQQEDYERMAAALRAAGRPIVFSICAWDWKGEWMMSAGHLWRSTFDIGPCFSGCQEWYRNIDQIIDENNETAQYAGPGHWNDPDMMEVGNAGLSYTEAAAHFSMWAIMAAPLIAGNDLRNMSSQTREILTNTEVIAVDQDPAGIQGTRVVDNGDLEVWMKPLCSHDGPEKAVALLNRSRNTANISVSFGDIGVSGSATVRDLWAHEDLGEYQNSFSADVPSHAVVMVKIVDSDGM